MVRTLPPLALLVLCLLFPAPAFGQGVEGEFQLQGREQGGPRYEGWASVAVRGAELHVTREVGGERLSGALQLSSSGWRGVLRSTSGAAGALAGASAQRSLELTLDRRGGEFAARWVLSTALSTPQATRRGAGRWRLLSPVSTEDHGALMRSITRAALAAAEGGNLPAELMLTEAGNRVEPRLLVEGPEIFARAAALIAAAEEEVLIQEFHWGPSQAEAILMAALQELERRRRAAGASQAVRVRIVVDRNRLLKELRHTQRDLEAALARAQLDPRFVAVEVSAHTHWLYGALHTKAFVVDGRSALVTGANVNAWAEAPRTWYELGVVVHGPAAASLRAEFVQLWREKTKRTLPALASTSGAAGPGVPVLVTTRRARGNLFQDNNDEPASQAFFAAFRGAQRVIRILSPHLNDDDVRRELIAALRRGVRVELILSRNFGVQRAKLPFQGGTNSKNLARLYRRLKDDPAALSRLDVRWFSRDGQGPILTEETNSHAKYMSCDGQVTIVGCSNLDEQSFNHSRELNLVIEDANLTAGFDQQVFTPVFARSSPVDWAEHR